MKPTRNKERRSTKHKNTKEKEKKKKKEIFIQINVNQYTESFYFYRFTLFTSSATRSSSGNTQICSITQKIYTKFLASAARLTWNTYGRATMEVTHP
jgi:hypothetical protein